MRRPYSFRLRCYRRGVPTFDPDQPDYYAWLRVRRDASHDLIRLAHKALIRDLHPDLNPEADPQQMALVNLAYEMLANPLTRARHDLALRKREGVRAEDVSEPLPEELVQRLRQVIEAYGRIDLKTRARLWADFDPTDQWSQRGHSDAWILTLLIDQRADLLAEPQWMGIDRRRWEAAIRFAEDLLGLRL